MRFKLKQLLFSFHVWFWEYHGIIWVPRTTSVSHYVRLGPHNFWNQRRRFRKQSLQWLGKNGTYILQKCQQVSWWLKSQVQFHGLILSTVDTMFTDFISSPEIAIGYWFPRYNLTTWHYHRISYISFFLRYNFISYWTWFNDVLWVIYRGARIHFPNLELTLPAQAQHEIDAMLAEPVDKLNSSVASDDAVPDVPWLHECETLAPNYQDMWGTMRCDSCKN